MTRLGALFAALLLAACTSKISTVEPPTALKRIDAQVNADRVWRAVVGGEEQDDLLLPLAPNSDGRRVYIAGRDGSTRWIVDQPVPSLSMRGGARPVISGEHVYAGFDNGKIAAYELARGQMSWEVPLATPSGRSEVERLVDADGIFQVTADELFAVAFHGRAAALELASGRTLWQRDMSSARGLAADPVAVYVTDADSQVWALDRNNGGPLWTQADLRARGITAPVRVGDALAVGDFEGYIHLLDAETGRIVGRTRVGPTPIVAPPLAVGDLLVAQDVRGRVTAWRISKRG